MWICPICGSKEIGKISRGRYFCGECCHEWTAEEGEITVYQIAVDGSIVRLRSRIKGRGNLSANSNASSQANPHYTNRNVS